MRIGRRPYFSASQPKSRAPMGRQASVRKIPSATVLMSVLNSLLMALSEKVKTKKSKASSDQPPSAAKYALRCAPESAANGLETATWLAAERWLAAGSG